MNLHEFQAKNLLKRYGLPISNDILVSNDQEVVEAFKALGGERAVIKAQIHAGGRGKAGGVKLVKSLEEAREVANSLLGSYLVTNQTDHLGQPINLLLMCKDLYPVGKELYFGVVIDRARECVVFMASTEGGVEIESVATEMPDQIIRLEIDPLIGLLPNHAREMAYHLNLNRDQLRSFIKIADGAYQAFIENDLTLLEINPLAIQKDGSLLCIDAKVNIDDNALYRHPNFVAEQDRSQSNTYELKAAEYDLSYVSLDGNIGCMVNGAGLAMATMDIIKFYGANPANFLDVGGDATRESVQVALNLIVSDPNVEGVLINIFGGIVQCDIIAEAVIEVMRNDEILIPIVLRLDGNRAQEGLELVKSASDLNLIVANDLADAAQKVIMAIAKEN